MRNPDLSKEQIDVLFGDGTEPPFTGTLLYIKDQGQYVCANCHQPLFNSDRKFDSGTGWPSFDEAIEGAVVLKPDTSHGTVRTAVNCSNCGGHLGHVFEDGPKATTGLRYCMNSLSLDFEKK